MVIETEILSYWRWLFVGGDERLPWFLAAALPWFVIITFTLAVAALLVGFVFTAIRYGPMKAGDLTYQVVRTGVVEIFVLSRRRIGALARLAIKESIRRSVIVVFIIFLAVLLFASWFLGSNHAEPAKLYLSFVLTVTTYLILLLALFLSAFSLPTDIKNKTIYTIVTKPVRAGEIVLGRVLGFTLVGTLLLVVMGLCSFFFVKRALSHRHTFVAADLQQDTSSDGTVIQTAETSLVQFHRHELALDVNGEGQSASRHGHSHWVEPQSESEERATRGPEDMFRARVPIYGKIRFRNRLGQDVDRGISVGNEWAYRSFIEGDSPAAAIWTFEGVDRETYPGGLPLELNIRVFRTYKADIVTGISGSIVLKNPKNREKASQPTNFMAKDYYIDQRFIKAEGLTNSTGNPIDLFEDLVDDEGRIEVWIQCLDRSQYFGVAQADCYLRRSDSSFVLNFAKGYVGIWIQMVLVIGLGVVCSTFLSGPVAMLFTLSFMVVGFFKDFVLGVALEEIEGGGPVESLIRLVTQRNVTIDLEETIGTSITKSVDLVLRALMQVFAVVLPDFRGFSTVDYVANGFNISASLMCQDLTKCLAYVAGLFVVGYFFLRTREVAA